MKKKTKKESKPKLYITTLNPAILCNKCLLQEERLCHLISNDVLLCKPTKKYNSVADLSKIIDRHNRLELQIQKRNIRKRITPLPVKFRKEKRDEEYDAEELINKKLKNCGECKSRYVKFYQILARKIAKKSSQLKHQADE